MPIRPENEENNPHHRPKKKETPGKESWENQEQQLKNV